MCIKDGFYGLNMSNKEINNKDIGKLGEDIACKYLIKKGFFIVCRNYRKRWGELDIIADKDNHIHFIEVKSVCVSSFNNKNYHNPEENVDGWKIKQIRKMIWTYFDENNKGLEKEFYFHVICVYINMFRRFAKVNVIENIIP